MTAVQLPETVSEIFDYIEGDTPEKKIVTLINTNLSHRLHECEEEIYQCEVKYRMSFDEFKEAWEKGKIPDMSSHQVERDYMVWEGLEHEKKKWLSLMKKVR